MAIHFGRYNLGTAANTVRPVGACTEMASTEVADKVPVLILAVRTGLALKPAGRKAVHPLRRWQTPIEPLPGHPFCPYCTSMFFRLPLLQPSTVTDTQGCQVLVRCLRCLTALDFFRLHPM